MIVYGCSITVPDVYERCAARGVRRAAEADSVVLAHAAAGSVARSYNLMLDEAARFSDLEALVLVHQDAEITDAGFAARVRAALADARVGLVGALGAGHVRSMAWWEGETAQGSAMIRYRELGGGTLPVAAWPGARHRGAGEVETVAGLCLVLSPWAVRALRFDEQLPLRHGYDYDISQQVRAAGRAVVAADLPVLHHHAIDLVPDPTTWMEAHVAVAEKWDPARGVDEGAWRHRARRAEAEAAAARLVAASHLLHAYARADAQQREIAGLTGSTSWRLTSGLRRLNAHRRRAGRRG